MPARTAPLAALLTALLTMPAAASLPIHDEPDGEVMAAFEACIDGGAEFVDCLLQTGQIDAEHAERQRSLMQCMEREGADVLDCQVAAGLLAADEAAEMRRDVDSMAEHLDALADLLATRGTPGVLLAYQFAAQAEGFRNSRLYASHPAPERARKLQSALGPAASDDREGLWARVARCPHGVDCDHDAAVRLLQRTEAANLAVWSLRTEAERRTCTEPHLELLRAAQASYYEPAPQPQLGLLLESIERHPPPARSAGNPFGAASPDAVAFSLMLHELLSGQFGDVARYGGRCKGEILTDDALRSACEHIQRLIADGQRSPSDTETALLIEAALQPERRDSLWPRVRELHWQQQQATATLQAAMADEVEAAPLLQLLRRHADDSSARQRALVRYGGHPLTPPEGWEPQEWIRSRWPGRSD